ncbi:methyl-viologen-reducing hydrogenase delta subunit [Desulfococcus multivorans DSM 2059]|uniref:Methyl-viologen-reducing hydrogenase delta subunit n=2 Tax=Desulfococcus multivorans TaxID=897 RepID=S7TTW8_DESML|nr:BamF: coenzyme F420 non-reducing hydrogenase, delta subunit [Desulfococcus multivorans]EPR40486.1 methyl-viologen-reducing hydrogenase delta subunit [Desulfococcus multivorans DSM 2059]SKA26309.1 Coenzyme F420-reducing hydrogenase, delta subunit [Desulfococcus multivorans DSM 2059]
MCSGRVDLDFVLRAFSNGVDGVFIGGCRLNECNYITHGNYHALNMVLLCRKIMEYIGLNPERLRIEFMSSGDGILLSEIIDDFTTKVKTIGPLGKAEGIDKELLASRLAEIRKLVPYIKLEKNEKLGTHLSKKEDYETFFTIDEVEQLINEVVSYYIDPAACKACGMCFKRCPVDAIDGGKNRIHVIDQDKCIKCGTCLAVCPPKFSAVRKISGEPVPPPIPEEERIIVRKGKEASTA